MHQRFEELKREVFRLHARGRYAPALALVEAALLEQSAQAARLTFWAAALECRLARAEEALQRLQAHAAAGGWVNPDRLRGDDDLAPLRERPGWEELVAACERRLAREQVHTKPALLFEPPEPKGAARPPLVVALHMRGGNIDETRANWLPVTAMGCALAMPQGNEVVGPGEFRWGEGAAAQVGEQLAGLRAARPLDPGRVVLGGASQGAGLAVEMAVRGQPVPARGFVAIVGAPPVDALRPHLERAKGAGLKGVFITGDEDHFLGRVRDAHALLAEAGLAVKLEVVPGLGHYYPETLPELLRAALGFTLG